MISLSDSVLSIGLTAACCVLLNNMLGHYQPQNEKLAYLLILTAIFTALVVFIADYFLNLFFGLDEIYITFLNNTLAFRAFVIYLFITWCAFSMVLWYRLEEQSESQKRLLITESLAKEAELNKLRHQLQPHFLFNSLNSVYALTIVNPKEAGTMIMKLASFLRGTLKRDDEVWIQIEEEMEYIQLYLDIEKVRFSHRLSIDVQVAENTLKKSLPGTFLQPIVENAIKFGLYNTSKKITIQISVNMEGPFLKVQVKNPFDPDMKNASGTGFGLSAIRRRLYLLFGDKNLLQTETQNNNLYITTLKIPQRND
ncbi:MAG: sensor histidine kinase [Pedobacter sp.]|nr:MAG: sensor histidine kinase [Pedobacter sp.]